MFDGLQYEYVQLTSNGGRRVFMNNPDRAPEEGAVYPLLTRRFYKLTEAAPLTVHYDFEKRAKGMAIVTPDGRWLVPAKTEGNWAVPNVVVRDDLVNGQEIPLDIPAADTFNPVAFVWPHKYREIPRAAATA